MAVASGRPTVAVIDHDALAANVAAMRTVAGQARLCAVVKADAYGHGAVDVAFTALDAGADMLAVAVPEEGAELRSAGVIAPILVLADPSVTNAHVVVEEELETVVSSHASLELVAREAARRGAAVAVHVKVDVGMHRVGIAPSAALGLVRQVRATDGVRLAGVATHLPVADEAETSVTEAQLAAFAEVVAGLGDLGTGVVIHAANSAATMAHPGARLDLVRVGIALYGVAPSAHLAGRVSLRPVMSLRSAVSAVRRVSAGEGVSYGHTWRATSDTWVATVPAGYADGVVRALGATGGEVLIAGRRAPIAGTVTMDQLMVACGDEAPSVGDEVVLLGSQGEESITAEEWARRVGTIGYEIVCGVSARVPRRHVGVGH